MFDFSGLPFFDNHTHRINSRNHEVTPLELAAAWMHGWGDINPPEGPCGRSANAENCSPEVGEHVKNTGVVKTVVNYLSQRFGCEPTLDSVTAERNKRTLADGAGYSRALYEEEHVFAEMVDDGAPFGDDALGCFPTRILRLYQMDPCLRRLMPQCATYAELKKAFDMAIRKNLAEGFIGVKCHVLEVLTGKPHIVEDSEAEKVYSAAMAGDTAAWEDVYLAIFCHTLTLTQELKFHVHIHTGCTGNPGNGLIFGCDPINLCPLLCDNRFYLSRIIFLHGSYPDVRHAALLAHSYPNVWVDLSWSCPWVSLNFSQCLEETLAIAPHDKILFGTGQHNYPEMVWAASKIAKTSLAYVLEEAVRKNFISVPQAQETAEQVLYKNAKRLYGI
jgi:uncharacterized protein